MSELTRVVRGGWPRLLAAAITGAAGELCALGLIASAAWLITTAASRPPLAALGVAIVGVRAFALFRGGFRYLERLAGHDAALRAVAGLRVRIYSALVARPARRTADGLHRLVSDVDAVQEALLRCVLPALLAGTVAVAAVVLTTALLLVAGLVVAAALAVAGVLVPMAAGLVRRHTIRRAEALDVEYAVRCLDVVEGARDLVAFGAAGRAMRHAGAAADRLAKVRRGGSVLTAAAAATAVLVQGAATVVVTLVAIDEGPVTVAVLALSTLVALESVLPLVDAAGRYAELGPAVARVAGELDVPEELTEDSPETVGDIFPVRLDDGWVRYAPESPCALRGVGLTVDRGGVVAVVGASGAGKSTLLATLTGDVPLLAGTMSVAGISLRDKDSRWVRRAVRGLAESGYVFHTTIRANLVLARPDATDDELARAVRLAGLADWIDGLPHGMDTVVGTDGEQLSGGQRQRLLLARVLLADPPLTLLDEPCEGLHPSAADELLTSVLRELRARGRAVVVVSHRLAVLGEADEIVVLDAGTVAQQGTHDDLVAREGIYRDLWAAELVSGNGR